MSTLDTSGFEYEEDTSTGGKEGIVFFGQKGSGKTSSAYLMPGTKVVLSFDGKSLRAKDTLRPDDKDIQVFDMRKYISHLKLKMAEGGKKTIEYAIWTLDQTRVRGGRTVAQPGEDMRGGCDWVVIDGLDILIEQAEMAMRFDAKLDPFQAFANLGYWKLRKLHIRAVHEAAFACARQGVIWTTYTDRDEIVNNATLVSKKEVPKWMDIVMYDTDTVVKTQIDTVDGKSRFRLYVISSKIRRFRTGDVLDVTDVRTLSEAKPAGAVPEEMTVDLNKAQKRKKARWQIDVCPKCSNEVSNELGVIHCTKCDWVHEDEGD